MNSRKLAIGKRFGSKVLSELSYGEFITFILPVFNIGILDVLFEMKYNDRKL
jgi:hypothetical protein